MSPPPADPASLRQARRALTRELRARRKTMARELKTRRRAVNAELAARRRALEGDKPKRRWPWLLLLLLLILLALLQDCSCSPPPVELPSEEPGVGPSGLAEAPPEKPPAQLPGRIAPTARPAYASEPTPPSPWLSAFRMQVAARSPRLSACFVGAQAPGTLKWTTSVEPEGGRVSEHELEPTLESAELSREQRSCLIGVLSEPGYRLEAGAVEPGTPVRVGLVLEF